jgi:hypothetical protein
MHSVFYGKSGVTTGELAGMFGEISLFSHNADFELETASMVLRSLLCLTSSLEVPHLPSCFNGIEIIVVVGPCTNPELGQAEVFGRLGHWFPQIYTDLSSIVLAIR